MRIRNAALKTCQRQWMIGRSGERGSGISVLVARHDDDDDDFTQGCVMTSLLSILADLNNTVIWMVSIHPLISNSSSPLSKPLETISSAPIKIGSTVSSMFYSVLVLWQGLSMCHSFDFFYFTPWSTETVKSMRQPVLFFFCLLSQGLVFCQGLGDRFVSQNQRIHSQG